MQKLYLDCDGVILDTINKSYQILQDNGITDSDEIQKFYRNLNWDEFIILSGEIDNSVNKIKKLIESGLFEVKILTHVNSDNESVSKNNYFNRVIPEIEVISVPKGIEKADVVDARGAILVDDFLPNLEYWEMKGGTSIKFSDSGRECKYIAISDLLDLFKIDFSCKKKVKM